MHDGNCNIFYHVTLRWDAEGPFKPLHALNPTRLAFIRSTLCHHFRWLFLLWNGIFFFFCFCCSAFCFSLLNDYTQSSWQIVCRIRENSRRKKKKRETVMVCAHSHNFLWCLYWKRSSLFTWFRKDPDSARPFEGLNFIDVGCGGGILSEVYQTLALLICFACLSTIGLLLILVFLIFFGRRVIYLIIYLEKILWVGKQGRVYPRWTIRDIVDHQIIYWLVEFWYMKIWKTKLIPN